MRWKKPQVSMTLELRLGTERRGGRWRSVQAFGLVRRGGGCGAGNGNRTRIVSLGTGLVRPGCRDFREIEHPPVAVTCRV
jgi:hypothetical protein